jgi:predicted ABC-class ATPase
MKFDLDQASIGLAKAAHLRLHDAAGSTVAVLWGAVWLTQEDDSRDYELRAGESMVIRAGGVTLVTAFSDSAVSVLEPCDERATSQAEPKRELSAAELEHHTKRAKQLRNQYAGLLLARVKRAVANNFRRLREHLRAVDGQRSSAKHAC